LGRKKYVIKVLLIEKANVCAVVFKPIRFLETNGNI